MTVTTMTNQQEWDDYVLMHHGHPLQLWGWGELKAHHNWQVERVVIEQHGHLIGAAQLQLRPLPAPFHCLVYVSRGPVVADEADRPLVLEELARYAQEVHHAVSITVEPDWEDFPSLPGWRSSRNTILIPRTVQLDLTHTEDELLAAMSKKTRQYIRKSQKEPIEIRLVSTPEEQAQCLAIYHETAKRAGFGIHGDEYYEDVTRYLGSHAPLFAAFSREKVCAFLWLATSPQLAFELYGGVSAEGQQLRVNYALKWHAIQAMKAAGVGVYDLNGLLNDGILAFKQGFSDHETLLAGTYDKPLSSWYLVWTYGLPLAKRTLRQVKRLLKHSS